MHSIAHHRAGSLFAVMLALLPGCGPLGEEAAGELSRVDFVVSATVRSEALAEISGLETAAGPSLIVHNDGGPPEIFVLDSSGEIVRRYRISNAGNRDWEDLSWVPHGGARLLAVGDIGDNEARRSSIRIYFLRLPAGAGGAPAEIDAYHGVDLTYPDGPRDCEAMAYDAASGMILLLSKRDQPPRLYGVSADAALAERELGLEFLGAVPTFRPPTRDDMRRFGKDAAWVSQPTGMDIDDTGRLAAVITYRSLYLWQRGPGESWAEAFTRMPREFLGPASRNEEAIAFHPDMNSLFISTEGLPAPVYHVALPAPVPGPRPAPD